MRNQFFFIFVFLFMGKVVWGVEHHFPPNRFLGVNFLEDSQVLKSWGRVNSQKLNSDKVYELLVWNLYKGEKEGLIDDLESLTPHYSFILAQEAYTHTMEQFWIDQSDEWYWVLAQSFLLSGGGTGVASGSRYYLQKSFFLKSTVTEPIVGTPKMILIQEFPLEDENRSLLVANIHAINFVSLESFKTQLQQLFDAVKSFQGPMIIAGDFNTWNSGRLEELSELKKKLSLQSVQFDPDERTTFWGYPLDHILIRGIEVVSSKVLSGLDSSDHNALELKWKLK